MNDAVKKVRKRLKNAASALLDVIEQISRNKNRMMPKIYPSLLILLGFWKGKYRYSSSNISILYHFTHRGEYCKEGRRIYSHILSQV